MLHLGDAASETHLLPERRRGLFLRWTGKRPRQAPQVPSAWQSEQWRSGCKFSFSLIAGLSDGLEPGMALLWWGDKTDCSAVYSPQRPTELCPNSVIYRVALSLRRSVGGLSSASNLLRNLCHIHFFIRLCVVGVLNGS